ncbi:MAG: AIR synthase-related protein [Chitinophagaceae bacterium]|nr:AIR synthase-related protein [Chitinophagaceae bacterium]
MNLYSRRGVSSQKEEVTAATKHLDKGIYANAFCRIFPDILGQKNDYVNVMHADGAGTKSILAYLYWKETGDLSVWKGIAQDAIVMNLDDMLCCGIYNGFLFSSSIDRNKNRIPAEVLKTIVEGSLAFFDEMKKYDIEILYCGGETADVGDLVQTIAVNATLAARWEKKRLITNEKIAPGNVIVGLGSYGKAVYETEYNSGIGSNGLTSARHDLLSKIYAEKFPETFDATLDKTVVYCGKYNITDEVDTPEGKLPLGKLLLSPTRTFAPVMREILIRHFDSIYGMIHCTGGGQTKCMKYVPHRVHVIKNNLPEPPEIFRMLSETGQADEKEMYQVYNMGIRMEIYTDEKTASSIIQIASAYRVPAQIIGTVEASKEKRLSITSFSGKTLIY